MPIAPESTLVVILGASEFPETRLAANVAFEKSARDFERYLLAPDGFNLPDKNRLSLFDESASPLDQEKRIAGFLKQRIGEMAEARAPATDLILYYVGHGGFYNPGDEYFLALRATVDGSERISGYPIHELANTLKERAAFLRRYVILDCCFAAAAYESFQSGPLEVARQKTRAQLPAKGTALLCASGPREPSKAPKDQVYTMFSGVMLEVLREGDRDLPEWLSLYDVGTRTEDLIRERFSELAVRPHVLSPDQMDGELATIPLFPNMALRRNSKATAEAIARLEARVSELGRSHDDINAQYRSLQERLHELSDEIRKVSEFRSPSRPVQPPGADPNDKFSEAVLRQYPFLKTSTLTPFEWRNLPGNIKEDVIKNGIRVRNGHIWLEACIAIATAAWLLSLCALGARTYSAVYGIAYAADGVTAICGFFTFIQFTSSFLARELLEAASASPASANEFESHELVVEARNQGCRDVLGLEITPNIFSLTCSNLRFDLHGHPHHSSIAASRQRAFRRDLKLLIHQGPPRGDERHPHPVPRRREEERHPHSVPRRRECARSEQASLARGCKTPGMKDAHILCRGAENVRGMSRPRSSSSRAICNRSPGRFETDPSQPAERSTPINEFAVSPRSMHHQPIDPRDWTQAYRLLGSRSRLPILSLTAQSSVKCDSCGALTVEPAATRLLGQDL